MSRLVDRPLTAQEYEDLAAAYARTLPLEHFMESIPQATQRKIATASLDLVTARRPEVQVFSELLVQYRFQGELRRVVPDGMVRICDNPPLTRGSFNIEIEAAGPLWVLEWVSSSSEGKDYGDAFEKYERDLRVPYCLLYHPEAADFQFYRHTGRRYQLVKANAAGRYPLPELDLELGLIGHWVRFWYKGALPDLPADLQKRVDHLEARVAASEREVKRANRRAAEQRRLALVQKQYAEEEKQRAEAEKRRADEERQRRLAAEKELDKLRALVDKLERKSE